MNTAPLALRDGRRLGVRPVQPDDAQAEQDFVMALSPASRYRRFHVGLRRLPESTLAQLTQVDQQAHVAVVAHAGPAIVADARYVRRGDGEAEFALAVVDDWQRLGVARRLLWRLAMGAAERGVRALVGEVLADNLPMIRLMQAAGARFRLRDDDAGLVEVRLDLTGPCPNVRARAPAPCAT